MKKNALFLLLVMSNCSAFSQTTISGGIMSNTTWSASGNPYIVTGNTVVFEGVELTIDPGVIVKFNAGVGLELRGKLIAIGTATDSITFTSNVASPGQSSWPGITVIGTNNPIGEGDQVTMEYCKGLYADKFVNLDLAYHGPYIFRHCYFANNNQVNHDGGSPATIFEYCTFKHNHLALAWCQFDSRVSHSMFIDNANGVSGIGQVDTCLFTGHTEVALAPYGSTTGCTIQNNYTGVKCAFNAVNNTFINNNVSNNSIGVEILTYFSSGITFTGNTICNNTTNNLKLLHSNNANLAHNCWCSTDSSYIRSTIYDGYDNISYGLVNFMPFNTDCPVITVGIDSPFEGNALSTEVYPNPFSNNITFIRESDESTEVTIFDMASRKIVQTEFVRSTILNTEALPAGIYIYQLKVSNGSTLTGKIVKE